MATFVFLLALYAALAGLVAFARRDRFTGPGIADGRSVRGAHLAARSTRNVGTSAQTDRDKPVPAAHCAC